MKRITYLFYLIIVGSCASYNDSKNSEPPPLAEVKRHKVESQATSNTLDSLPNKKWRRGGNIHAATFKSLKNKKQWNKARLPTKN